MPGDASPGDARICAAEVIAALSLAADLGHGSDFEHGLRSTLFAMRLAERLGVDRETAAQTYYACLLLYVGCTAESHLGAQVFGDYYEHLGTYLHPVVYGSPLESMAGLTRSIAPGRTPVARAAALARTLPRAGRARPRVFEAQCEVASMLSDRLGLPGAVPGLFAHVFERWDGKGILLRVKGEEVPPWSGTRPVWRSWRARPSGGAGWTWARRRRCGERPSCTTSGVWRCRSRSGRSPGR